MGLNWAYNTVFYTVINSAANCDWPEQRTAHILHPGGILSTGHPQAIFFEIHSKTLSIVISVAGIMTRLGRTEDSWFDSWQGERTSVFSKASIPALGPTHLG